MDLDTLKTKLGIGDIREAIMAELELIAHQVETSTVASDLAVLRSRAVTLLGHLASGVHEFVGDLANRISSLEDSHAVLAARHDALEEQVTAPAPPSQPSTQPDVTRRQAPDDAA